MMNHQPTSSSINRGEFLRSLGLSSAALLSFYCLGTSLTACSSKSNDPTPAPGGTTTGTVKSGDNAVVLAGNADPAKGAVDFTLDLTAAGNAPLTTKGGYLYANNIIVALTSGGSYAALSKVCTHQSFTIEYVPKEANFYCANHGSRFTDTGAVKNGPAGQPLQQFKTSLSTDGKQLRITA